MPDLQDYVWLRQQWRRFRHVLAGGFSAVLILCASGLLLLEDEENPQALVYARLALMVMPMASTVVALRPWYPATRSPLHRTPLVGASLWGAARGRKPFPCVNSASFCS